LKLVAFIIGLCLIVLLVPNIVLAQSGSSINEDIEKSVILLFDSTGSMKDNNKIESAKIAAKNVFRSGVINENDEVALIVFDACDNGIRVVQSFTTVKSDFISMIDSLSPNDGTPLYGAKDFAKNYMLQNSRGRVKKIIMFTDGMETCK
jgi:Mg-chelatase subunit ChlD